MANVGDVLLPVLGGLAGMNPYIGSGVRTGLTVAEALQRKKWKEEESQRREEDEAAAAEQEAADAAVKAARGKEAANLIKSRTDIPAGKREALAFIAQKDPDKAILELHKWDPPEEEAPGLAVGEIGEYLTSLEGATGGRGYQATLPGEHGSLNIYGQRGEPEEPTVQDVWEPKYKQSAGKPWLTYWTDEDGNPQYTVNEAMREALDSGAGETAVDVEEMEDVELELHEARAELQEYAEKKSEDLEMIGIAGPMIAQKLAGDERYKTLEKKVDILDARHNRLMNRAVRPPEPPADEQKGNSQVADQADVETVYFDALGNPIR
jgi:hypothetical protein